MKWLWHRAAKTCRARHVGTLIGSLMLWSDNEVRTDCSFTKGKHAVDV